MKSRQKTDKGHAPSSGPAVSGRPGHLYAVLFIAAATFAAYSGSLNGTWALDDTAIGQYAGIQNVLNARLGFRKIAYLTFLANRLIDPVNPLWYRVTNVLIHVVNAALVYCIAWRTTGLSVWREKIGAYRFPAALLSGVVFALHPLNINAVSYIVQRMASLAAMFVLLALLSYISAATADRKPKALFMYFLSAVLVFLGIFSKENAAVAPPLILLYDLVFLRPEREGFARRAVIVCAGAAGLAAATLAFLPLHKAVVSLAAVFRGFNQPIGDEGWAATDVYWTPLQHILTEFRIVGRYLLLTAFPLPRLLVFDWWGFPLSSGIISPPLTGVAAVGVLGAAGASLLLLRRAPFLSYGILWYLAAISLESFLTVGSDLYFEHRNYLPLAGLAMGVICQAAAMLRPGLLRGGWPWIAAAALAMVLGALTFQRNMVWRDSITLWSDTVAKAPENIRARIALGNSYLRLSDFPSARKSYAGAVVASQGMKAPHFFENAAYSLGMLSLFAGDLEEAEKVIRLLERRIEGGGRIDILKAFYRASRGELDAALALYKGILPSAVGMDRVVVHTLMGDAFRRKGAYDGAIEQYRQAVFLDPNFAAAYFGMGDAYMGKRDVDKASIFIGRALEIDPNNSLALAEMAEIILTRRERPEKALQYASRAVGMSPPFHQPYLTMGNVLLAAGRDEEAGTFFGKAAERGAEKYLIPFSKARAYFLRGDREKVRACLKEVLAAKDVPAAVREQITRNLEKM